MVRSGSREIDRPMSYLLGAWLANYAARAKSIEKFLKFFLKPRVPERAIALLWLGLRGFISHRKSRGFDQ